VKVIIMVMWIITFKKIAFTSIASCYDEYFGNDLDVFIVIFSILTDLRQAGVLLFPERYYQEFRQQL